MTAFMFHAADQLVREEEVEAIIVMQTWEQAALVVDVVGNRAQVPIVSLSAAAITPPLVHSRWPFLIQMAKNGSEEIQWTSALVHSCHWRKVIVIYEDDSVGGDSGMITLLSDALGRIGAEVEYYLALPSYSSLSNPEVYFNTEAAKLLEKQSRVFIVVRSSISMATHLFAKAKQFGLMGGDSAWILLDSLCGALDIVDKSFISSIQGALGIKTYYSEDSKDFLDFKGRYQEIYRAEYPNESHSEPNFHAIQAYDTMKAVLEGVKSIGTNNSSRTSGLLLLNRILANDFSGLSGDVHFHNGMLSRKSTFKIVNVFGRSYKELGLWSSEFGFSKNNADSVEVPNCVNSKMELPCIVNWPGDLRRVPKGWAMPSYTKKLRIGVPGNAIFNEFVKVERDEKNQKMKYDGFCIALFKMVLEIVEEDYPIPYEFIPLNGSYNDLVDSVINNTFDAIVGDVTILANRSKYVDFTQPYVESGLSMIVKAKDTNLAWTFLMPFTRNMWIATLAILFHTTFVVWAMEHQSNAEFKGKTRDQLGTALWFTFSSLTFSHKERISSYYTKVVVIFWLFLVFVLTSTYIASLTSMLTVPRLEPSHTDLQWIRKTDKPVGCDEDSFVRSYLRDVLKFNKQNIKNITDRYEYASAFTDGSIVAAFLELPYKKIFMDQHCGHYAEVGESYTHGGLGFVFQRGSPIARDFSQAILNLSETGVLKRLENERLGSFDNCADKNRDDNITDSRSLKSFWALYLIYGIVSTLCLLIKRYRMYRRFLKVIKIARLMHHFFSRKRSLSVTQAIDINDSSSELALMEHAESGGSGSYSQAEIEMIKQN